MLIDKETFGKLKEQCVELFGPDISDIRLEEIEKNADKEFNITISFLVPNKNISSQAKNVLSGIMVNPYLRQYKDVVINKEDGSIRSIKMHKDA